MCSAPSVGDCIALYGREEVLHGSENVVTLEWFEFTIRKQALKRYFKVKAINGRSKRSECSWRLMIEVQDYGAPVDLGWCMRMLQDFEWWLSVTLECWKLYFLACSWFVVQNIEFSQVGWQLGLSRRGNWVALRVHKPQIWSAALSFNHDFRPDLMFFGLENNYSFLFWPEILLHASFQLYTSWT